MTAQLIRLQPVPDDIRLARRRCAEVVRNELGMSAASGADARHRDEVDDLVDSVEIIASELVTNSIRAQATTVVVEISVTMAAVELAVIDDAPGQVHPRDPRLHDTDGRGLRIVGNLSERWGVDELPAGKRVWARLTVPGHTEQRTQTHGTG